jgi:hypothetical protein
MGKPVVTIGNIPTPDNTKTWVRKRVLELLAKGIPRHSFDDRGDGWWHRPGALPWWELRTRVGGRVDAATFAEVAEGLIADGLVIEAWLAAPGRRTPSHVLLLPGQSSALKEPVVQARGHAGVLANEPWASALTPESPPWPEIPGSGSRSADPGLSLRPADPSSPTTKLGR